MIEIGFIYKITNNINGKVYIGQTRRDIPTRWHEHTYQSFAKGRSYNSILHHAIRKYGENAFSVEQIEECDIELLEEREAYWIQEYGSAVNGYNASLGGKGWHKCSDDDIFDWWNKGLSMREIAEFVPLHPSTLSKRLRLLGVTQQEILDRGKHKANIKKEIPVYQYDIDGNYIRAFSSLHEAQDSIGGRRIKFSPNTREKTVCGYQWRKYKTNKIESVRRPERPSKEFKPKAIREKKPPKITKPKPVPKPVYQYSIEGEYIREYPSVNFAASSFGMKGSGGIRKACDGTSRESHGYRWSYEKCEMLPPMRKDKSMRSVAKMDTDDNIIRIYEKITDAANEHNVTIGAITSVCNGVHEKCCGYKWKFLS